ncbi:MAG: hydroxymethylglutaryl-CoA lyase [Porticoccaceae bacterium]|nr:hydroxymethylglutaryl-CoA lyase [Porticoccaceae bacterium]|tara:strand:+ start:2816 stop:3724 length:909 start_codon:yes stop_codon:yes gene_type:complete
MNYPKCVKIVEVGPRDGLQNEKISVDVDTKVQLISLLTDAGLSTIEAGSFVSPKWVPQMAGSDEVFARLPTHAATTYTALTPNMQGLERAIACGVKEVAVFAAASESFSQKNINCSISESLNRFKPVAEEALKSGLAVRGYISCVVGCPYQDTVDVEQVVQVATELLAMGCYEVSLGDTIGVGTPASFETLLNRLLKDTAADKFAIHAHDTYGQALANILRALQLGITTVDSSVAGLGGCPYAKGASGNVASEDLVYMLNGLGIQHGIDLPKLITAGNFISHKLNRANGSKVACAQSPMAES